ncbi:MAG: methyltransferase domain-containing protein, partial [Acidobacteriaceae bacterium]|nr:methyltransferase domain-containing protein [Acidobacteriaceae bacterium]
MLQSFLYHLAQAQPQPNSGAVPKVFAHRLIEPELMDHAEPEEARRTLADLVRINRFLGGHSTIRSMFAQIVSPHESFTLLDIGAASGDTARVIRESYPHATVTSLDYNQVNIEAAPHPKVIADAFHMPFQPESFDFVLSSLFLHHFTDDQVALLLRSFHDAARRGVLIAD